jgi:hypothetical protein
MRFHLHYQIHHNSKADSWTFWGGKPWLLCFFMLYVIDPCQPHLLHLVYTFAVVTSVKNLSQQVCMKSSSYHTPCLSKVLWGVFAHQSFLHAFFSPFHTWLAFCKT